MHDLVEIGHGYCRRWLAGNEENVRRSGRERGGIHGAILERVKRSLTIDPGAG